ncbi:TonB-dependent receptor domain-containing protein [Citreimonas salinaria]|uniref:Hemoglobin/transferrin/lactoferrin receptor protein n=1 Tax=Citreimonas salinaria TaxID=321339 RepID=A0A1H3F4W5_9RHOB|nr:TonB-dependent receptor [Citreimonas salinaria]SDX85897.1 hemoglobin/transferrin/lactoferrin receptor protein [Citreimonas salinaria]
MKAYGIFAAMTAGLLPVAALAQDQDDEVFLGTIVLEYPTVPGLGEETISVTSDGIALSNPADLSELFVAEPTIAVGSSIPMSQKVYVNGIEENNLAISIDGARQNNKIFHHNTTTLIDPALLKAVRIDPGVAPADAGPGALGGALAYETKDAADLLAPGDTFGGRYKFEYDSNGDVRSNSVSLYGTGGRVEYLGFLKYATGDLREDGDGETIVGSGTDVLSGLGKMAYQTATGSRFELSYERVTDDEARPYRANIGTIIGGRPVPATRPYELERTNVVFSYTKTAPTATWDPTIRLAYSGTELFNDESALSTMQTIRGETTSFSGEASNRFVLGWGTLNAGVDFYSDRASIDYTYLPNAAFDEEAREKLKNLGVFAQMRTNPTEMSKLSFGLRADFQEFTGVDGSKQSEAGLSANISGEVSITDRFSLSGGYSHIWGGLELAENYIMNPAWTYPEDGLEETTADNIYVAASYDVGNWAVDGKVFATQIDNARAAGYGGGPGLTTDVETRGFELGLGTGWDGGFFRAGFARVDTEVDGRNADSYTGNYLTMPMGDFLTFQTAHRLGNGILVGGDAQVAFDYDDTYDPATGGQGPELPGYTVVNAFAEYSPGKIGDLTLRAEINNLFDESYASRATYGQEFDTVVPLREPGRSVRLSAEIVF